MWVFDGEQWRQDDEGDEYSTPKTARPAPVAPIDELVPELQVIEIVHVPRTNYVPPFPLP
ncbi:MAG TPA: hypothetical protein VF698_17510 [Thermoanaerobaculia bacterium]|jgi:hypothetical protein